MKSRLGTRALKTESMKTNGLDCKMENISKTIEGINKENEKFGI